MYLGGRDSTWPTEGAEDEDVYVFVFSFLIPKPRMGPVIAFPLRPWCGLLHHFC